MGLTLSEEQERDDREHARVSIEVWPENTHGSSGAVLRAYAEVDALRERAAALEWTVRKANAALAGWDYSAHPGKVRAEAVVELQAAIAPSKK